MAAAFLVVTVYLRNAVRCGGSRHWRLWKFMTALNFFIVALLYFFFIVEITVEPMIIKLNTFLIILLVLCNGVLGRDKYGKRY
jgi:hypothetical protein